MKDYGVSLIPSIVPESMSVEKNEIVKTKVTKTGQTYEDKKVEMLVTGYINFRWVNDENPEEYLDVPWFLTGSQDDPSQSFGSAITYCTRYFLTSFFSIAQPDSDVDAYRAKQKMAEEEKDRAIVESILEEVDRVFTNFLEKNPSKKAAAKDLAMKYAKSGNYKTIKDPEKAAKLLDEAMQAFGMVEDKKK